MRVSAAKARYRNASSSNTKLCCRAGTHEYGHRDSNSCDALTQRVQLHSQLRAIKQIRVLRPIRLPCVHGATRSSAYVESPRGILLGL